MLLLTYYAQNYAGIIGASLLDSKTAFLVSFAALLLTLHAKTLAEPMKTNNAEKTARIELLLPRRHDKILLGTKITLHLTTKYQ